MEAALQENKGTVTLINVISVTIPVVVAVLLFMPKKGLIGMLDVSMMPHINAGLNSATALLLVFGLQAIKNQKVVLHKRLMMSAFALSSIFLVLYVLYHAFAESTKFGDVDHDGLLNTAELNAVGVWRTFYVSLLVSHIVLAAVVLPFVLRSMYFGLVMNITAHKKISKITFPLWLFVALSGVAVYAMISPYYAH